MKKPNKSDLVREFVNRFYIEPTRKAGLAEVSVRAGDVHSKMKLTSQLPLVCGAIGANLFAEAYRVSLIRGDGPQNGASLVFTFKVLA
jgi:hypothetical protein